MKHPDPNDYENEDFGEESDDYVYVDEDDDARTARGSGAVAVLGVVAAICAVVLVGVMLAVCLTVLGVLISRMKIAQALKLGED